MAWKHFSADKQWKWSNIKNNPKGKKSETTSKQRKGGVSNTFGEIYTLLHAAYRTQKCQWRLYQKSVSYMPMAVIYSALNTIEISEPITKFAAVKIRFGIIYLFAIVSACDTTWKEEVLLETVF